MSTNSGVYQISIGRRLIWNRIQTGWTFEQAVTTPKGKRGGPRVHV